MIRSDLFDKEYLVSYVDTEWLGSVAPSCDAIMSLVISTAMSDAPPQVYVPNSRIRSRSLKFRSVLEHEIVHINQVILCVFPGEPDGRNAEDVLKVFIDAARSEYEANVLQLTRWPGLFPHRSGISLEHWCVLRGYSSSLEKILIKMTAIALPPREVVRLLDIVRAQVPNVVKEMGADQELAPWFSDRFEDHIARALAQVMKAVPEMKENETFRAAGRWLKTRL